MKLRLTDLAVRRLSYPAKGQVTYWDESAPGFGIRCSAKSKSFVVMYGEKRRLKTIGRYPNIPLAEARKDARQYLLSKDGVSSEQEAYDYEAVVDRYLADCQGRLRASTLGGYEMYLRNLNLTGPIAELTRGEIIKAIERYTESRSSQNYAFTTLKVFFNWAVRRQYLQTNAIGALNRPHKPRSRERVLSDGELRVLLTHTLTMRGRFNDIVSLLALTGQRRGEIAGLRWAEVQGAQISFPAERTKNKRHHAVPLCQRAKSLLSNLEGGGIYVFGTSAEDKPYNGWTRARTRLLRETNLEHFTLHDLRRTFSTIHAKMGTPIHVTEKLLNHASGAISGVSAVYNRHSYEPEMEAAMNEFGEYIGDVIR